MAAQTSEDASDLRLKKGFSPGMGWILALAFLCSLLVRLAEAPRWDDERFWLNGERLLATHDAYFWVAGAEGVNEVAEAFPMAALLRFLSIIIPLPSTSIAFWVAIILGALVTVPIALWAWRGERPHAALLAGVLASLTPAYFNRTRLGFFDSDWATLFFPLLIGWLLALQIELYLRKGDRHRKQARWIPVVMLVLAGVATPWHPSIGLYLTAMLGIAAALVWILSETTQRGWVLFVLITIGLVIALGWIGVLIGLLLLWLGWREKTRLARPGITRLLGILLVLLLGVIIGLRFGEYLLLAIPAYLGEIIGQTRSPEVVALAFPTLSESVRETQRINFTRALEGMAFHPALGGLGILGYLILLRKRPTALLLLPMFGLGFLSIRSGIRFTMFAAPVLILGLVDLLERGVDQLGQRYPGMSRWRWHGTVGILIIASLFTLQVNWRAPVETVVNQEHARALTTLGEIAESEAMIWTWWDFGYATQHFTGLETFADGRRNTGDYLFSLGSVLGSDSLTYAANFMAYAAQQGFKPWNGWSSWGGEELDAWLDELEDQVVDIEPPGSQYLIVQWEGLEALPWIQYYGSWDFSTQQGQRSQVLRVAMPLELDLETGLFSFNEGEKIGVVSVDRLGGSDEAHFAYPTNAGGPRLLLNNSTGQVFLLDERAYRSNFTQLLITPVDLLDEDSEFVLLVDETPNARVFALGFPE